LGPLSRVVKRAVPTPAARLLNTRFVRLSVDNQRLVALSSGLEAVLVPRSRHPNPHIEQALRYAESKGWRVEPTGKSCHAWGRLYCPHDDPECRCGEFCVTSISSTPRNPETHARQIRRRVDGRSGGKPEPRQQAGGTEP
jgi:hypothetical protein